MQQLSEADYSRAVTALPLVSIDVCVTDEHGHIFLGKRNNAPARNAWFTPGVRIRKNEPIADALARVLQEELRLPAGMVARATLMGAWDHLYPDSAFDTGLSTHYVNLPHSLRLMQDEALTLHPPQGKSGEGEQHAAWQWFNLQQAAQDPAVHPYVRVYAQRLLQPTPFTAPA